MSGQLAGQLVGLKQCVMLGASCCAQPPSDSGGRFIKLHEPGGRAARVGRREALIQSARWLVSRWGASGLPQLAGRLSHNQLASRPCVGGSPLARSRPRVWPAGGGGRESRSR